MIGDDINPTTCRTCDSEFQVDGFNIDEEITFCPYCGSVIDSDNDDVFDEAFYDDNNS